MSSIHTRLGQTIRLAVLFLSITALWSMVRPPEPQSAAAAGKPAAPNAPAALNVAPANDLCAGAQALPATAGASTFVLSTAVDILDATTAGDPPNEPLAAFRASRSVWYTFTPPTSTTYVIDTADTATTVQDTVIGIFTSPGGGGCAGPFARIGGNDDSTLNGVAFAFLRHKARISINLVAGTQYFIEVWKFGINAPAAGETTVQLRISEGAVTATPTNTGIPGGTVGTPFPTTTPTAAAAVDAVYSYTKRGVSGTYSGDTAMHVRKTTEGVPLYSGCVPGLYPPDNECDDDEGATYTVGASGNTGMIAPPSTGFQPSGFNSILAGVPLTGGELVAVQGFGSTTIVGDYDLYIHRPSGPHLSEGEGTAGVNDTLASAVAVPTLPPCTQAFSDATGNQRLGFDPLTVDSVAIAPASPGWTVGGGFRYTLDASLDVDYYGPFTVGPTDSVFVALDGSLDCAGCPHDQNTINTDTSLDIRDVADGIMLSHDGSLHGVAQAEAMSFTPGATFFVRLAAKAADIGKGYRLTACRISTSGAATATVGTTPTATITPTPTPTPRGNDTCASAAALTLNIPAFGSLAGARNDYQLPALSPCFTNNGAIANPTPAAITAAGRDVVYSFTAPSAGSYSFKVSNLSLFGGSNLLLHIASDCLTADPTATPSGGTATPTPAPIPACLWAANRTTSTTQATEEVMCVPLTAGQTVFVYVDEATLNTGFQSDFFLVVEQCNRETEPNDRPAEANALVCGIEGSWNRTPTATPNGSETLTPVPSASPVGGPTATPTLAFPDIDLYVLPAPASSENRLFAMAEGGANSLQDTDIRLTTTNLDSLEFDTTDNDILFGTSGGNLAGALFDVTPVPNHYLRINASNAAATSEPYRVFSVVQPPRAGAVLEAEPNDSITVANYGPANYFFGNLSGKQLAGANPGITMNNYVGLSPSLDQDFYAFFATAGEVLFLSVDGDPGRDTDNFGKSGINPQLVLVDASGKIILRSNETTITVGAVYPSGLGNVAATFHNASQSEAMNFRAPYTGRYYAVVASGTTAFTHGNSGQVAFVGDYLLSISRNCLPDQGITPTPTVVLATATPTNTLTPTSTPTVTNTPQPDTVDIVLTKTESIDPVTAGSGSSNLTYVVTLRNNPLVPPIPATNLQIQETLTLPAGVAFVSATPGLGTVSGTVPNLVWTIPTLASGASTTLTVVLTVGASALPGTDVVGNTATVLSINETRSNTVDDTVTVRTSIITRAELNASKTPASGTIIAGNAVSYTVTSTNSGPSDAQNLVLTDTLPANGAFQSATASAGGSCTTPAINAVGGTVTCTWLGVTAPSVQRNVVIAIRSCAGNLCNSSQVNSVTASSGTTDPGLLSNTATSTLTVQSQSDLSISKTAAPNPVIAGNPLVYTLAVNNAGPSNAAGTTVVDTLPAGVTFVSATVSPAGPTCSVAAQVVTCSLGIMGASGQCGTTLPISYVITINTTVNPLTPCSPGICAGSPGAPLVNTATVSTTNCLADPNSANNSINVSTNVRAGSDVLIGVQVFDIGAKPLNLADLAGLAAAGDLAVEAEQNAAQRAVLSGKATVDGKAAAPAALVVGAVQSAPAAGAATDAADSDAETAPDAAISPMQMVDCIASGDFVRVVYTFSNTGPLAFSLQRDNPGPEFEADVPAQIALEANTCGIGGGGGVCTVTNGGGRIEWNGTIPVGGTVSVFYIGRIRPGVVNGDRIPFTGTVHFDIFNIGQNTASRSVTPPVLLLIGCPVAVDPNRQLGCQVHLPILNFQGQDDVCRTMIEVQYIGCNPSKAVLVTWGEPGFCPPQAAGPLKVECTGLLFPGSSWIMMGAQIPTGSKGGMLFKFTAQQLSEVGIDLGFDDIVADLMCETLFFGVVGDADDYRRFKKAYNEGLDFAGINQRIAMGSGILAVEVLRHCPGDVTPGVEVSSKYIGVAGTHLGIYDPVYGGYGYYVPLIYANKASLSTVMYIQNGGLECSSLELWFKAQDDCLRARICDVATVAPGETYQFDAADCVGPDWQGSAWIRASEQMAVAVDIFGRDVLMTYVAEPVPFDYTANNPLGAKTPTTGEKVAYGPLIYSEYQGWDTGVQVMNLNQTVNAKVKVYFLDRSGDVITTLVDWICPRGSQTFFLPIVADLPGTWVGSIRVESQVWWTPGTNQVTAPDIVGVATLMKYGDVARTEAQQAVAYNLLPEHKAYKWQIGGRGNGGLESGVGLIAIPSLLKDLDGTGVTSETAIMNLVAKPGFTDFAIYIYDQNGLLDFVCQKLFDRQVEYIDLQTWGYVSNGFKGSAVISATFWEHDVIDEFGFVVRNLVGLGAVMIERTGTRLGEDIPGDEAAGDRGIPFGVDQALKWCPNGPSLPVCPGQPQFQDRFRVGIVPLGAGGNIPDAGATGPGNANFTLMVDGSSRCLVTDVDLQLDITHGRTEDLDAFLTHAAVNSSEMFTDLCTGNALGINLQAVLDDDSTPGIGTAACLTAVGGSRRQATEGGGGLTAFDGQGAGGAWTLTIQDDLAGFTGRLNSATLAGTCFRSR